MADKGGRKPACVDCGDVVVHSRHRCQRCYKNFRKAPDFSFARPQIEYSGSLKRCRVCQEFRPAEGFEVHKKLRDGTPVRRSDCKECRSASRKRTYDLHREKYRKRALDKYLSSRYGFSLEERNRRLEELQNRCEICGSVEEGRSLAVDHCHKTGTVRGFLCSFCNRAIGMFADDPKRLRSAADYLERSVVNECA